MNFEHSLKLALIVLLAIPFSAQAQPADTILTNGKIVTVDRQFSIAQAVAVRDGKFLAVGSNAQIEALAGPGTVRMNLGGRTVLPGLIDTHAHVAGAGEDGYAVSFRGVTTTAEALDRIQAWAARTKPGEWIIGDSWHPPSQLKEGAYLTRREIDRVSPNNPVYMPTVGHFAMANSMALSHAGITKATADPPGGVIDREADGEPNGVLEESAIGLLSSSIPPPTIELLAQKLKTAMRVFNSFGITSAIDGGTGPDGFRVYQSLWEKREMTLRTGVMFLPAGSGATTSLEDWEKTFRSLGVASGFGDEWLSLAGIGEVGVDGGMTLRTALLREAYPEEPDYHGFVTIPGSKLNELVAISNRYGWRVGLHAVGDAAIDQALDAYEYANRESSIVGKRFVLIHASLIRPDQLERSRKLGVRVDIQNVFMWDKADTVARFIGRERADRAVPTRLAIDTLGIENVGAGSDFGVNTMNPFINIYIMVSRKNPDGKAYGKDQAITRQEAIRLYTSSAAGYTFEESRKGSIEAGKLADLVVISDDVLTVPEEKIKDITAVTTMVGGRVVHGR